MTKYIIKTLTIQVCLNKIPQKLILAALSEYLIHRSTNNLVITIAENIEAIIPILKVTAKPLITPLPNI